MDHVTFDSFTRRAAALLNRRSLVSGLGAALLAPDSIPLSAMAKKKRKKRNKKAKACRKRVKRCRQDGQSTCEDPDAPANCEDVVRKCCKKACQSLAKVDACLSENFAG